MVGLLLSIALVVGTSTTVRASVRLTEIMFDPIGSEVSDEFLEFQNVGSSQIDLTGWRVGDGDAVDLLVPVGSAVLQPGQYGVVVDPDYDLDGGIYGPPPAESLVFVVGDPTFGHSGWSNVRGEVVLLLDASGDTVDAHTYSIVNTEGVSEERVDAGFDVWKPGKWIGGTFGRTNSVSPKVRDLAIEPATFIFPFGESPILSLRVLNHGQSPEIAEIRLVGQDTIAETGALPIAAGGSAQIEVVLDPIPGQRATYVAEVVLPGDEDPTNDRSRVDVTFGVPRGAVLVTEMMVAPAAGEPEWVEVENRSSYSVDLDGWGLRDGSGRTGRVQVAAVLGQGDRGILAKEALMDGLATAIVAPWPTLNDGADSLVLLDAFGSEIDQVAYDASRRGRSLERIDLGEEGGPSNWLVSTANRGATPGRPNSVAHDPSVDVSVEVSPSPFVEMTEVIVTLKARRARLILRVFDRMGRLRRTLAAGTEVGSRFTTVWDGRDDRGRRVKPGPFVVDVEAITSAGATQRARTTVIYGKGLGRSP